jgi:hypothetical protein
MGRHSRELARIREANGEEPKVTFTVRELIIRCLQDESLEPPQAVGPVEQ